MGDDVLEDCLEGFSAGAVVLVDRDASCSCK